jgi:hypothetical protein
MQHVADARGLGPRHALNLALARVVLCGVVLASSEVREAARWAEWARELRAPVPGLGWALPLVDASGSWVPWARWVCMVATALGLLGWRVRWTLCLSALSAALLFALPHFSGGPRHSMHLVWFMLVLAVSPCGLRLRLPWANGRPSLGEADAVGGELSLALLRGFLAIVYFFPGFWKLRESGLAWIFSDNLQNQMYWKWSQLGALPTWRVDRYPSLVTLGAFAVVLLELSFPLLVARPRLRILAALLGLGFHVAAAQLMFLPFAALFACYVVLVDWEWLLAWLQDTRPSEPASHGVGLTRATLAALRGHGGAPLIRLVLVGGVLSFGAGAAGFSGAMRAYPFACYPTFQWLAGSHMPDLWIEVLHGAERRWLADSPARGGLRPQARWGMAWQAAGVYGDPVSRASLLGYYAALPPRLHAGSVGGDRLRFYRALVPVRPEAWREPPLELTLLAEVPLE